MLAKKFITLTKDRWLWPPLNNYSPFIQGSAWNCGEFFNKFYRNRSTFPLVLLIKEGESIQFVPGDKLIELSAEFFSGYLKNPKILTTAAKQFAQYKKAIDKYYYQYSYAKIAKTNPRKLLSIAKKVRQLMWDLNALVYFSLYFDKDFAWQTISGSKFKIRKEEFEQIWDKGIQAISESFDKEQLREYLQLIIADKSSTEIAEACQYFLVSYFAIKGVDIVSKELTERYKEYVSPKICQEALLKENKLRGQKVKDFAEWEKNLTLHQKILVDYFQEIIRLRDGRKNIFGKGLCVIWRIAEKMFEQSKIDKNLMPYYTFAEMVKGLAYLKKNADQIALRKNGFIMLIDYKGKIEFEYSDYEQNKKILMDYYNELEKVKEVNEIKGQIGCPGQFTGKVKIVLNATLEQNFETGNILVTGMTRPEFVPLMKKAGAIITDEGGITCHAAIISRELNKPCVIGTKIATKVLKDGDMVEVDANKGIVKIIK